MNFTETSYNVLGRRITLSTDASASDAYSNKVRENWSPDSLVLLSAQLLRPQEYFLDIGCNIGLFSLPLVVMTQAKGLAIDALSHNLEILNHSIATNQLEPFLRTLHSAVTDKVGTAYIQGAGAHGTVGSKGDPVPSITLDSLADGPSIKLVKMDIEGSEPAALSSSARFFLKNRHAAVIFEANGAHCFSRGHTPQDLISFFEKMNKRVYMIRGSRLIPRTSADMQEVGLADYIASSTPLEGVVTGFDFNDMPNRHKKAEIIRALTLMKPGYAYFLADQLRTYDSEFLSDPEVNSALETRSRAGR